MRDYIVELQEKLKIQNLFISSELLTFNDTDLIGSGQFGVIYSGQLSEGENPDRIENVAIKRVTSEYECLFRGLDDFYKG